MTPADQVRGALTRTARRLGRARAAQRVGWWVLGAVLAVELGLLAAELPLLSWTCLVGAGVCLVLGAVDLVRGGRPSTALAAQVLDARLSSGAVLAAADEVLAGGHPRFGPHVLDEAAAALAGVDLRGVAPVRVPPGLILGIAAAVLLPLLLPHAEADELALTDEPPGLLEAEVNSGGGGGEAAAEGDLPEAFAPVVGASTPEASVDTLSLEEAQELRERLEALSAELGLSGEGGDGGSGGSNKDADALNEALERGDLEQALAALERLAEAAGRGDRAARARIEELAEGFGTPGAGGADPAALDAAEPAPATPESAAAQGAPLRLPPALEAVCSRYF